MRGVASDSVGLRKCLGSALIALVIPCLAFAQTTSGVIIDQTGLPLPGVQIEVTRGAEVVASIVSGADGTFSLPSLVGPDRSEERRVGKECRSRWSPYH